MSIFYAEGEKCICNNCGYQDNAENLDIDPQLLCVRCPVCDSLMTVEEEANHATTEVQNLV